ncbi:TetR family transcriptional regulator [Macrococcus sp. DPC7161]|nr:TetR family transcriptional regulator [Macrococcus sp. DPC7161]
MRFVEWKVSMETYNQMNEATQRKIQETFIQLIQEKPFKKITIQDISSSAGINRGTFYHHYLDKYDLVEKIIQTTLEDLENHLNNIDVNLLLDDMNNNGSDVYCKTIFDFIDGHRDLFVVLLHNDLPYQFEHHLKLLLIKQFKLSSMSLFKEIDVPEHYIANFAASALLGLIDEWLTQDMETSPEAVSTYFFKIIQSLRSL